MSVQGLPNVDVDPGKDRKGQYVMSPTCFVRSSTRCKRSPAHLSTPFSNLHTLPC